MVAKNDEKKTLALKESKKFIENHCNVTLWKPQTGKFRKSSENKMNIDQSFSYLSTCLL